MDDVDDGLDSSTVQRKGNALQRKFDPEGLEHMDREEEAQVREQVEQILKLKEDLRWQKKRLQLVFRFNKMFTYLLVDGNLVKNQNGHNLEAT